MDVFAYVYADTFILSGTDKTQDRRHHLIQRDCGSDLVIGYPPQQRLDALEIAQNAVQFFRSLAVEVCPLAETK